MKKFRPGDILKKMASATGLEPATYGLGNRRSILVSYADNLKPL